jgi:uncharacterized protein YukE
VNDTDGKAFAAAQAEQYATFKSFSDKVRQLGMDTTAKAIDNIKIEKDSAIRALGLRTTANVAFYDKSRELIDTFYQHETDLANGSANVIVEIMNQRGVKTQAQLDAIAFQEIAFYNRMVEAGDVWSKKAIKQQKEVADAAVNAASGTKSAWDKTYSAFGNVATILDNIPGKVAEIGAMAARAGQAIMTNLAEGNVWGAVIAGATAAVGILSKVLGFASAGRDAVKKFAESMGGFDTLHDRLLKSLGGVGEAFWIELTQQVGRGDEKGAAAVIARIQAAFDAAPDAMAAAAGYKTLEELQAIADKAEAVYQFMVKSGKYGAEAIAAAFKASKDAAVAAMSDEESAHQKALDGINDRYKDMFDKLDSEYKTLSDSVGKEAEEAFAGVVETQERARMVQIEAEKAALEVKKAAEVSAADQVYQDWLEAGKTTDEALRKLFQRPYKIPVEWDYGGGRPGFAETPGDSGIPPGTVPTTNASAPAARDGGTVNIKFPGSAMAELVVPFIPGVVQDFGVG